MNLALSIAIYAEESNNNITVAAGASGLQFGGGNLSYNGTVSGNTITMASTSTAVDSASQIGTYPFSGVYGGASNVGAVTNNTVNVDGGSFVDDAFLGIYGWNFFGGGSLDGDVTRNTVNINTSPDNGDIWLGAYGGINAVKIVGASETVGRGAITNNAVNINDGGKVLWAWGGFGNGIDGDANDNSVTVNEGGWTSQAIGGMSGLGTANNNVVTVNKGAEVSSWTGKIMPSVPADTHEAIISGGTGTTEASGNTVNIHNGALLDSAVQITGGIVLSPNGAARNNTLNLFEYQGRVGTMGYFENYNFYLSDTVKANDTLLTAAMSQWHVGTTVNVGFSGANTAMKDGDTITLIDFTEGIAKDMNGTMHTSFDNLLASDKTTGQGMIGLTREAEFSLAFVRGAGNRAMLQATLGEITPASEGESLTSGGVADLVTLTRAGDLVAGRGLISLIAALNGQDCIPDPCSSHAYPSLSSGWSKPLAFAAIEGGAYKHNAGHKVDVDGFSALAGIGWRNDGPCGLLVLGAFFETGYSDFDSHDVFGNTRIKADGDNRYYGGGILGRYDWNNGFYTEGSIRVGVSKTKYRNDFAAGNERVRYKASSAYFGAHVGFGYKLTVANHSLLDISAKYLWARQNSDSATILGDRFKFDAADSHRVRVGARYSYKVDSKLSPYAGVAFEYEFDGRTRAGTSFVNYGSTSLKGSTGIAELGVKYSNNKGLSVDLGVQGHVGRRRGIAGTLGMAWSF